MIEINVIPPQLRKKKKKGFSPTGIFKIPREAIIGLIGGLFVLLMLVHVVLQVIIFVKFAKYNQLKARWSEIEPDKKKVDVVLNELRDLQAKINAVEQVTTEKRVSWARKMNAISDALPRGVWLKKLSYDGTVLVIDGSAYSKTGNEMVSPNNFVSNLKDQENFMRNVENIEVGSIQRGNIKTVDIANFLITVKLKENAKEDKK